MIDNQEKIAIILNKLDNLEAMIKSFIDNAEVCAGKYSLEDELANCNIKKGVLMQALSELGGSISLD